MDNTPISRRNLLIKGAALGVAGSTSLGLLAACAGESNAPTTPDSGTTNEGAKTVSETTVGTTYDNLLSAIQGETNATTKYMAFAAIAKEEGLEQIARLFECTADAEKIHIDLEYKLAKSMDDSTELPTGDTPPEAPSAENLIAGASGEIYETSDMYPKFIEKAEEEGESAAAAVFTRAKLAEGYHAELYMNLFNNIEDLDEDTYHLCPFCGYIRKGEEDTDNCPICGANPSAFKAY